MNVLEQQFQTIIEQHGDKIYRICLAYLYDKSQVEDLYQEVLMNVWKSLKGFKQQSQITTWLFRITVNTTITYNRKEKKRQQLFVNELPQQVKTDIKTATPSDKEQQLNQLHYCIHQLPENERLIIGLVLEDLSYKEIASIIGATTNLVGVKINRIKKKLKTLMNS